MAESKHKTTLEIGVDDRAVRQLAESMDKALSAKTAEAFEKSLDRSSKALGKLVEQQGKMLKLQEQLSRHMRDQQARIDQDQKKRGKGGDEPSWFNRMSATAAGTWVGNQASRVGQGASHVGSAMVSEGGISQLLSSIPFLGPILGGAWASAQSFYGSHVAASSALANAYGQSGVAGMRGGFNGTKWGVGPAENPALVAEFMQGAQLRGAEGASRFSSALEMNKLLGIGFGATGGLMNAVSMQGPNSGRNADQEIRVVEEAISTGMQAGLRHARLDEFMQTMASNLEDMQTHGIQIEPQSIMGMVRGITSLGGPLRGQAGVQQSLDMTRGIQNMGNRGSLTQMLMMQAAGYGNANNAFGHSGSYMQTRSFMQRNANRVLPEFLSLINGMGGDNEARAYQIMEGMREAGVNMSIDQAMQYASMNPAQLEQLRTQATSPGSTEPFNQFREGERANRGVFGTPAAEAGYEWQRAGMGGRVSGDIQAVRGTEMRLMRRTVPRIARIVHSVADYGDELISEYDRGGMSGVLRHVGGDVLNLGRQAAGATANGVQGVTNTMANGVAVAGAQMVPGVAAGFNAATGGILPQDFVQGLARGMVQQIIDALVSLIRNSGGALAGALRSFATGGD